MPAQPERELPEHHVWEPEPQHADGQPFDRYGHALLREIRGREPPHERWRFRLALFLTIVFHIVLLVLVDLEMRPQRLALPESTHENAIAVNLYETPAAPVAAPAPPPPIELPPLRTRELSPRQTRVEQRNPNAITATIGETQSSPRLYGKQGQALLPPSNTATPEYAAPQPGEPSMMEHSTPLPYQSTRFDKDWAPDKESLGHKAFRRAVDATTKVKTIRLPGGIKIKCGVSPLMLAMGCGPDGPPPPPPKNDNDPRLSLPPPVSLTGKKVEVPAAPSTAAQPAKASTAPKPANPSPLH